MRHHHLGFVGHPGDVKGAIGQRHPLDDHVAPKTPPPQRNELQLPACRLVVAHLPPQVRNGAGIGAGGPVHGFQIARQQRGIGGCLEQLQRPRIAIQHLGPIARNQEQRVGRAFEQTAEQRPRLFQLRHLPPQGTDLARDHQDAPHLWVVQQVGPDAVHVQPVPVGMPEPVLHLHTGPRPLHDLFDRQLDTGSVGWMDELKAVAASEIVFGVPGGAA